MFDHVTKTARDAPLQRQAGRVAKARHAVKAYVDRAVTAFHAFADAAVRVDESSGAADGLEHLKDAHWQLAENEARMRELLDGQQELIVRRDSGGAVLFANRAYCEAFAVSVIDISGRRFRPSVLAIEFMPPDAGGRRRFAEQLDMATGQRWVLWEEHSLVSVAGRRDLLCVGRDVTDERRAAAELRDARDAADLANRAKSRFLASMSHEIRTPMNGILGMASLLADTKQSGEQQTYTRAIDQSARALLALIDEILDFSKIEAGKLQLAAEVFSLRSCVQGALELLEPRALDKAVDLTCKVSDDIPELTIGDPLRVRQIVLNLVSNAVKFTDAGRVDVLVRRQQRALSPSGSAFYEIVVKDTGIGISPEVMGSLFVEFEQAESIDGRRQSGTGLGLAISKRLARAMGGDIRAESAPGKGAVFTALLRLCDAPAGCARDSGSRPITPRPLTNQHLLRPDGLPARILIAEDNDINALLARRVSERAGCDVEVVSNGRAAVIAVEQTMMPGARAFDLILMDVFMPELDGLDATRAIKQLFEGQNGVPACPPIVALTANAFPEDRARCLAAGMDDYLAKPFDGGQLTAVVARWVAALPRQSTH